MDTGILLQHPDLASLQNLLSLEMHDSMNGANTLTINPSNCKILVIPPKFNHFLFGFYTNFLIPWNLQTVVLNIQESSIDSKPTLQSHLNFIENKLSRAVGIIPKLKSVHSQKALRKLYFSLVHPLNHVTFPFYIKKLATLLNKAVKLVGGGKRFDSDTPFYFIQTKISLTFLALQN